MHTLPRLFLIVCMKRVKFIFLLVRTVCYIFPYNFVQKESRECLRTFKTVMERVWNDLIVSILLYQIAIARRKSIFAVWWPTVINVSVNLNCCSNAVYLILISNKMCSTRAVRTHVRLPIDI